MNPPDRVPDYFAKRRGPAPAYPGRTVLSITGKVIRIVGTSQDITERSKADQKFKSLLESAPDAIVIVNGDGTIVLVNSQAEKIFGYQREELLGKEIEVLVPKVFMARIPAIDAIFSKIPAAVNGRRARPVWRPQGWEGVSDRD